MTPALAHFVATLGDKLAAEDRLRRTPRGTPARDRAERIVEALGAACVRARARLSEADVERALAATGQMDAARRAPGGM